MSPDERERSSEYKSQVVQEATPKRSKAPLVLGVLLVLSLLGNVALAAMLMSASERASAAENDLASAQRQVESSDDDVDAPTAETDDTVVEAEGSEAIVEAGLAAASAIEDSGTVEITVAKVVDDFARTNVGGSDGVGGYFQILKRSNDIWVVVTTGQNDVPQETIDQFGIPEEIIRD